MSIRNREVKKLTTLVRSGDGQSKEQIFEMTMVAAMVFSFLYKIIFRVLQSPD